MMQGNVTAITVYSMCSGALPLDPFKVMEMKGVQDRETCINDVQLIAAEVARKQHEQRQNQRQKK